MRTAEIWKSFHIDAAHQLPNVPDGHPCGRLHGHGYTITVYCRGRIGAKSGWVIDYSDIKSAMAPLLAKLDHHNINDVVPNSTCENLAVWLWDNLRRVLPLSRIVIQEYKDSGVEYRGK